LIFQKLTIKIKLILTSPIENTMFIPFTKQRVLFDDF